MMGPLKRRWRSRRRFVLVPVVAVAVEARRIPRGAASAAVGRRDFAAAVGRGGVAVAAPPQVVGEESGGAHPPRVVEPAQGLMVVRNDGRNGARSAARPESVVGSGGR